MNTRTRRSRAGAAAVFVATAAVAAGVLSIVHGPASAEAAAADGPVSLVEDYSYPGGGTDVPGITLIRGDGHIVGATCVAGREQIKATALDESGIKHDYCFEVEGAHGFLSLTLKGAYLIWADSHTVTATISVDDKSETKTVDPHEPVGVGIGESRDEATLLELRV